MKLITSYRQLRQMGFTLIELIIVLIIIGVLAAIAIPQFADLAGDADKKALEATVANVNSALAIDFGKKKLAGDSVTITDCAKALVAAQGTLVNPPLSSDYSIDGDSSLTTCALKKGSLTSTAKIVVPK